MSIIITEKKIHEFMEQLPASSIGLTEILTQAKTNPDRFTRVLIQYARWNGVFASGVVQLAGLIGFQADVFREPGVPYALSDRSYFIASSIFEAARDEFNDSAQKHVDPHRSLAQAFLNAVAIKIGTTAQLEDRTITDRVQGYVNEVLEAYGAYTTPAYMTVDAVSQIFYSLGFHAGSEFLADKEFSEIDTFFRTNFSEILKDIMKEKTVLHGSSHRGYAWVGVHSGHGGGVEQEHFEHALTAASLAFKYLDHEVLSASKAETLFFKGFRDFHRLQESFLNI